MRLIQRAMDPPINHEARINQVKSRHNRAKRTLIPLAAIRRRRRGSVAGRLSGAAWLQRAVPGGSVWAERPWCRDSRSWYPVTNRVKMTTPVTASAAALAAALPADQAAVHRTAASDAADTVTHTPDLTLSAGWFGPRAGWTPIGPAGMSDRKSVV